VETYDPTLEGTGHLQSFANTNTLDSYRRQISVGDREIVIDVCLSPTNFSLLFTCRFSILLGKKIFRMLVVFVNLLSFSSCRAVRDSYMTTGDGFMIVYSITDDKTLAEVTSIHSKLSLLHDNKKVPGTFFFFSSLK
jgi:hypothetical protein